MGRYGTAATSLYLGVSKEDALVQHGVPRAPPRLKCFRTLWGCNYRELRPLTPVSEVRSRTVRMKDEEDALAPAKSVKDGADSSSRACFRAMPKGRNGADILRSVETYSCRDLSKGVCGTNYGAVYSTRYGSAQ